MTPVAQKMGFNSQAVKVSYCEAGWNRAPRKKVLTIHQVPRREHKQTQVILQSISTRISQLEWWGGDRCQPSQRWTELPPLPSGAGVRHLGLGCQWRALSSPWHGWASISPATDGEWPEADQSGGLSREKKKKKRGELAEANRTYAVLGHAPSPLGKGICRPEPDR